VIYNSEIEITNDKQDYLSIVLSVICVFLIIIISCNDEDEENTIFEVVANTSAILFLENKLIYWKHLKSLFFKPFKTLTSLKNPI